MTVTQNIKTMQEQNKVFEQMEPNVYRRVILMAADIKQATIEQQQKWQQKRKELSTNVSKWYNR